MRNVHTSYLNSGCQIRIAHTYHQIRAEGSVAFLVVIILKFQKSTLFTILIIHHSIHNMFHMIKVVTSIVTMLVVGMYVEL